MKEPTTEQRRAAARIQKPAVRALLLTPPSETHTNGTDTGLPPDGTQPVQDADDL